jgi:hypothetical protein
MRLEELGKLEKSSDFIGAGTCDLPAGSLMPQLTTLPRAPNSKSQLYYGRQSVGQSVLVSGTHLGPATSFRHSLFDFFVESFRFVDVGRPL